MADKGCDAFVLVDTGTFSVGWSHRHDLYDQSVVACLTRAWVRRSVAHKWRTSDLTSFDCAVAEAEAMTLRGPSSWLPGAKT
jgi:hypothetical protein